MAITDKKKTNIICILQKWIRLCCFIFFIFIFIFCIGILYLQYIGFPAVVHERIIRSGKENGLLLEIGRIQGGILGPVIFHDVWIKDYIKPSQSIGFIKRIEIDMAINVGEKSVKSWVKPKEIRLKDISVFLPGISPPITILHGYGSISFLPQATLVNLSGVVQQKIHLQIKHSFIHSHQERQKRSRRVVISPAYWQRRTPEKTIKSVVQTMNWIAEMDSISQKRSLPIIIEFDMRSSADHPMTKTVDTRFSISQGIFRGIVIDNFLLESRFRIENTLRFSAIIDHYQHISGEVNIELEENEFSGNLRYTGNPEKLLSLIPPIQKQFRPTFAGSPLTLELDIASSPIFQPIHWDIEAQLHAQDIQYQEAHFSTIKTNIEWKNCTLVLHDISAQMKPNVTFQGTCHYTPERREILVKGEFIGDPQLITRCTRKSGFKKMYQKIWQNFTWSPWDPPRFTIDLYSLQSPQLTKTFSLTTNAIMNNIIYHDIPLNQVEGTVSVITNEDSGLSVNVENIIIEQEDEISVGFLTWQGRSKILEFQITSTLPVSDLLGISHPRWRYFLEEKGLTKIKDPFLIVNGCISFPPDPVLHISLSSPLLVWQGVEIQDVDASIEITGVETNIHAAVPMLLYNQWRLQDVEAKIFLKEKAYRASGRIQNISRDMLSIDETHFTVNDPVISKSGMAAETTDSYMISTKDLSLLAGLKKTENKSTIIQARSRKAKYDDLTLHDLRAAILYNESYSDSELTINHGNNSFLSFSNLNANVLKEGSFFHTDFFVEETNFYERLQLCDTIMGGAIAGNTVSLSGIIATLYDQEGLLSGNAVRTTFGYDPPEFNIGIDADTLQLTEGELRQMKGNITIRHGTVSGNYDIEEVHWQDNFKGKNIKGTVHGSDNFWYFNSNAKHIDIPFSQLEDTATEGTLSLSEKRVRLVLKSPSCRIGPYPFENVVTYLLFDNGNFSISPFRGKLYGGTVNADIIYHSLEQKGNLHLRMNDNHFGKLIDIPNDASEKQTIEGKWNASADLDFDFHDKGYQLNGRGDLFVREGNFWKVPVLSDFLEALNSMNVMKKVGKGGAITELKSDLVFQGDRIFFPNATTDGGLILITAKGYYWWESENIDMRFQAKPLNPFLKNILPGIMDPFAILLERRLKGNIHDPTWEEVSAIRDLFRSKKDRIDPPLPQPLPKKEH